MFVEVLLYVIFMRMVLLDFLFLYILIDFVGFIMDLIFNLAQIYDIPEFLFFFLEEQQVLGVTFFLEDKEAFEERQ